MTRMWSIETLICCLWECKTIQLLEKILWQFLGKKKSKTHLPYDTAIPVLDIYPREMKAHVHTKACT